MLTFLSLASNQAANDTHPPSSMGVSLLYIGKIGGSMQVGDLVKSKWCGTNLLVLRIGCISVNVMDLEGNELVIGIEDLEPLDQPDK